MQTSFGVSALIVGAAALTLWLGACYMKSKVGGHGSAVAKALGARNVTPSNPIEKRLLNIVEEIALASRVLPPSVYVLDDESINALAAGESPQKAAIVVTSGALRYLNRDELQGVIAHEFSHIYNNDMKFNMRMISLIFGIEVISMIGELVFRFTKDDSRGYSGKDRGNAIAYIALAGAALFIIGFAGKICASIIKAAVNRQREFLADASAMQFSGHDGIIGALKKIGGSHSLVKAPYASAFSYFFFAQAIKSRLFATHPPLKERIKRLEPRWGGEFITPKSLMRDEDLIVKPAKTKIIPTATIAMATASAAIVAAGKNVIKPKEPNATSEVPNLAANTNAIDLINIATADIEAVPEYLREQAADPLAARWIIYALLIDRVDRAVASRQHKIIATRVYPDGFEKIATAINSLKRESVVHLIFLCVPALKNLTIDQYKHFREVADLLIEEDGKVSLFEFNLKYLVFYPLDIAFDLRKPPKIVYNAIEPIAKEISVALSAIVYDQYQNDEKAGSAFDNVCKTINALEYVPSNKILTQTLERAYDRIQQSNDEIKQHIIDLAIASVKSDGAISPEEAETIHALRSALGLGYM
jgi:Zn-dependent protease with chaperone function